MPPTGAPFGPVWPEVLQTHLSMHTGLPCPCRRVQREDSCVRIAQCILASTACSKNPSCTPPHLEQLRAAPHSASCGQVDGSPPLPRRRGGQRPQVAHRLGAPPLPSLNSSTCDSLLQKLQRRSGARPCARRAVLWSSPRDAEPLALIPPPQKSPVTHLGSLHTRLLRSCLFPVLDRMSSVKCAASPHPVCTVALRFAMPSHCNNTITIARPGPAFGRSLKRPGGVAGGVCPAHKRFTNSACWFLCFLYEHFLFKQHLQCTAGVATYQAL